MDLKVKARIPPKLEQILQAVPQVPILFLWDRGSWHLGPPIREVLEANPRLEVVHFPVAAPDFNPQEHVWRSWLTDLSTT